MPLSTVPRDLSALFDPRSIAIVGASNDSAKWGHGLAKHALAQRSAAAVHLINRRGEPVLGHPTFPSLTAVGEDIDLVVISVPAAAFVAAVEDAIAVNARAIVGITAGLSELGDEGAAIEAAAVARAEAAGVALIGPNCLGIADTTTGVHLSSEPFRAGDVTILSQSGNLVIDIDEFMRTAGLGVARFVSLGNQADVNLVDLMRVCVTHQGTNSIAIYAEEFDDGRGFIAAARELDEAGKSVVLLAPGRSDAAQRGAASHTGSLTSPSAIIDAACTAGNVHRVDTPAAMIDVLQALDQPLRATGRRVAVLTDGGGHGAIAADSAIAAGLDVPALSQDLREQLQRALWHQSTVSNPVDLAGVGEQDPDAYTRAMEILLSSDEVDSVIMTGYFGGYATTETSLADREVLTAHQLAKTITAQDKPVVVQTIYPGSDTSLALREARIPVYRDIRSAAQSLNALTLDTVPCDPLVLPEPAPPSATDYNSVRLQLAIGGVRFPLPRW